MAQDGGIGRAYPDGPLCGRDDAGPIFPIGPADPRLPVQAHVIGVIDPTGQPRAFAATTARAELQAGRPVAAGEVELVLEGSALSARGPDGVELATHEAFWFAWSQFLPTTTLWSPVLFASDDLSGAATSSAGPQRWPARRCWTC